MKLLRSLKEYRKECILAPLLKLAEAFLELRIPLIIRDLIDRGIPLGQAGDFSVLTRTILILFLYALLGFGFAVIAQYAAARAATGFGAAVRERMMERVASLSYQDLDTVGTSEILTRMTEDIQRVQTGINLVLRLFLRSPFIVFGAMIMAFFVDVPSAVIFVLVIPLLAVAVFGIMLLSIPLYRKVQDKLDLVLRRTRENLYGVRVLRAFRREEKETEAFREESRLLALSQRVSARVSNLTNPLTLILINGAIVLLLHCGAVRVEEGNLSKGDVVALYNYMSQILVELIKLANLIVTVTRAFASAGRIQTLLDRMPAQTYPEQLEGEPDPVQTVAFDRVSLSYAGAGSESLRDVSFTARRGEVVGVIGGTGSGKTSLISLIARFYDATEGTVRLMGLPVQNYPQKMLRKAVAVVPQHAVLFSGSVADNLRWGNPDATEEQLRHALELAQATFVLDDPEGLNRPVEHGGANFSGGQRQRLSIARALTGDPDILILDDSFSALDHATEKAVREELRSLAEGRTVFLVSQRSVSLRDCDRILVLENGILVDSGTHDELLERCSVFREIYDSQFR